MLLAARLVLAIVFLLAGIAKTADRRGSKTAVENFGLSPALAQPLSLVLPLAEISIALMLIAVGSAWYGACAAGALLGVFVIAIGINLVRGRHVDCHCFGELHSAPLSWFTFLRTGALAVFAGWLAARGPARMGSSLWADFLTADNTARRWYIVAAGAACFLLLRAFRRQEAERPVPDAEANQVLNQPVNPVPETVTAQEADPNFPAGVGLPVGTPAPDFALPSLTGPQLSLHSLREEAKPIVLIFSSPYCEVCKLLWPNIGGLLREHAGRFNAVVINRGSAGENRRSLQGVPIDFSRVLLQPDFKVAEAYDCTVTPCAVLIGVDGRIQCELAVGVLAIRKLIASLAEPGLT